MKSKLLGLILIAGASAFAQTRFSFSIGSYRPGYNAAAPGYYSSTWGNEGDYADKRHRRAEQRALRHHQAEERYMYGDSWELREHQAQERRQLRHEQRHERNGGYDARYGPGHESAYDGMHRH